MNSRKFNKILEGKYVKALRVCGELKEEMRKEGELAEEYKVM